MARPVVTPTFTVPTLFGYAPPVSADTIADWQAQLDHEFYKGPRGTRLLIRWESSEPWQTLDRFMLWIAQDPRYVATEPWIVKALNGPSPRSRGHYCADGYCLCAEKANRWVGGATKKIDTMTWRIYRETGLYAWRWWVIQGHRGGHRYQWEQGELAAVVANMKGLGNQPPMVGDLPYAPFDARVIRAVRAEHKAHRAAQALKELRYRKDGLAIEEKEQAQAVAKALWDWTGDQASQLWNDGGELLPRYFEDQMGRAPIGHQINFERQERALHDHLERAAG